MVSKTIELEGEEYRVEKNGEDVEVTSVSEGPYFVTRSVTDKFGCVIPLSDYGAANVEIDESSSDCSVNQYKITWDQEYEVDTYLDGSGLNAVNELEIIQSLDEL